MKLTREPIFAYCQQEVDGWQMLPQKLCAAPVGEEKYTCAFVNFEFGLHMMASVKPLESRQSSPSESEMVIARKLCSNANEYCIHVSLALLRSLKPEWSEEEHLGHLFDHAYKTLNLFFPKRQFERTPDVPGISFVKHYFSWNLSTAA